MSELSEVPDWAWDLLDAVNRYEGEHPMLYRMVGPNVYQPWPCIGAYLDEQKGWPPREIQDATEFRRTILRNHPAHSTAPLSDAGAESGYQGHGDPGRSSEGRTA